LRRSQMSRCPHDMNFYMRFFVHLARVTNGLCWAELVPEFVMDAEGQRSDNVGPASFSVSGVRSVLIPQAIR
jgi:hypothetical protein